MYGRMVECTKVNGNKIKCMEMVFLLGVMGKNTKVDTKMIKKKVMEYLHGQMAVLIKEFGKKGNNMDKVYIL